MKNANGGRVWRTVRLLAAVTVLAAVLWAAGALWTRTRTALETPDRQDPSTQTSAIHRYNSPAERAEDDLLIVKVKAAIASEGLADNNPLTVDADHGRVTLTGVLASRADVARAVALASSIEGVTGVNNRLTIGKESPPITRAGTTGTTLHVQ